MRPLERVRLRATVVGRRAEPAATGEARRAVWPSLSWSWWRLVALTGLYFVAGKLGLSSRVRPRQRDSCMPPIGIALAALRLHGPQM